MRVTFFWENAGLVLDRANPYGGLLARALGGIGVEMVAGYADQFDEEWVRANQGKVDVIHLNWLHQMYQAPDLTATKSYGRCTTSIPMSPSPTNSTIWCAWLLPP